MTEQRYKITHSSSNKVIAENMKRATQSFDRLMGLMFRKSMEGFDGLWIEPCNSIHTFFCRFPLDILFLDSMNQVIAIKRNLSPWRMTRLYFGGRSVLELKGGSLPAEVKVGDNLEVVCIN